MHKYLFVKLILKLIFLQSYQIYFINSSYKMSKSKLTSQLGLLNSIHDRNKNT